LKKREGGRKEWKYNGGSVLVQGILYVYLGLLINASLKINVNTNKYTYYIIYIIYSLIILLS
jgi:hypothetical protein